jgi:OOP family OmpA-OmpF porin
MHHRRLFTSLALLGAALLAGCSSWSYSPGMRGNALLQPLNSPAAQTSAPSGANFTQSLAYEYGGLSNNLGAQAGDWADSDYFGRKGLAAQGGSVVEPEQNGNWLVPLEEPLATRDELATGRARLVAALDAGGRDRYPALAARAQERYDCWVERMEDDWKAASDGDCHKDFVAALNDLEAKLKLQAAAPVPPPQPARQFNVYFDFDKSNITPEAQRIIDLVASQVKADQGTVVLVGKADLSGTDSYNLALSKRRADAVHSALAAAGVPRNRVEERYVGMREPPVPTAPGVREPRNRVVEITFH